MFMVRTSRCVLCLGLMVSGGCGQRDDSLADVRGEVTFCGHPAQAEVLFEPLDGTGKSSGRTSTDTTDARGQFRLKFSGDISGALIGRHRVTIRVHQLPGSDAATESTNNASVGSLKVTQLIREVQSDGNPFHFRLSL